KLFSLMKARSCSFDQSPMYSPNLSITSILLGLGVYTNYFTDSIAPFKGFKTDAFGNTTPLEVSPFTGSNLISNGVVLNPAGIGRVHADNYWNSNNSLYYEYIKDSYTVDYSFSDPYHYKVGRTQAYNASTTNALPLVYTQQDQATSTWSVTTQVSTTAELETNYLAKLGFTFGGSYTSTNTTQKSTTIGTTFYVSPGYTGWIEACLPGAYANGTAKYKEYLYSMGTGTFIATGNTVSNSNEGGWSPLSNSSMSVLNFNTDQYYGR
ncbi:hypothetical protein, partial [Paenibacillus caui]|uniref:hypothetical protein n=1 Tax=Paenibacillus caui TaxID=2873927 RepID=UPI001CA824A0